MSFNTLQKTFFWIISLLGLIIFLFVYTLDAKAIDQPKLSSNAIEFLRISVPKRYQSEWLNAEKQSWEPWLKSKDGFLSRELYWDIKKEEALIIIKWSSLEKWKSIPIEEINAVQKKFEDIARDLTHTQPNNPFPIKYESQLIEQ